MGFPSACYAGYYPFAHIVLFRPSRRSKQDRLPDVQMGAIGKACSE